MSRGVIRSIMETSLKKLDIRFCVPYKVREGGPRDPIGSKVPLKLKYLWMQEEDVDFHVATVHDLNYEMNEQMRDSFAFKSLSFA